MIDPLALSDQQKLNLLETCINNKKRKSEAIHSESE